MIVFFQLHAGGKDEVGVVLFGTSDTDNELAVDEQYSNITTAWQLVPPSLDLLQYIKGLVQQGTVSADCIHLCTQHTCICTHTYTYTHIHVHVHTYIYMYMCNVHIQTCSSMCASILKKWCVVSAVASITQEKTNPCGLFE